MTVGTPGGLLNVALVAASIAGCGGGSGGDNPAAPTLTVQKAGSGTGTVTGGDAIRCGASCSASLASGAAVTLTATADAGSTFSGWLGCDSTSGVTCTVTLEADRVVTATFEAAAPIRRTLTVQRSGAGSGTVTDGSGAIDCGAACSASLALGAVATLTAAADPGSTFSGWLGCDSTSGATCTVTLEADRVVTATFAASGTGSLHVVNGAGATIADLRASPAGAGTWGPNRLPSPLAPGSAFTLADLAAGTYDFRAVASDGFSYWQTSAVSITAGGLVTWTLQPPTDVGSLSVVNHHCLALEKLYLRPPSYPTWSPNQLASPVAPGAAFALNELPVGRYDLRGVGIDGNSWTMYGIDVAAGGTFTWSLYVPAGTGCLTLVNNTDGGAIIEYLYLAPSPNGCTHAAWGEERLAGQTIPTDSSFTVSNIPQGPHDIWAISRTPAAQYRFCAVSIPAGGTNVWYLVPP